MHRVCQEGKDQISRAKNRVQGPTDLPTTSCVSLHMLPYLPKLVRLIWWAARGMKMRSTVVMCSAQSLILYTIASKVVVGDHLTQCGGL